jgi:cytochrome c553
MKSILLPSAALLAVISLPAFSAGDADAGRDKATTCMGCHGIPEYFNVYPSYRVPKLGGQHAKYIVSALQGYRDGQRSHDTMHAQAASLSEQDMQDIAAYFSALTGE